MLAYVLHRMVHAIPILLGVNVLTFSLFFLVTTPDDIARVHLGEKYATPQAIVRWKKSRGFDKPLFFNKEAPSFHRITDTLFFQKSINLFRLHLGQSESGRDIGSDIQQRMWPSLALAIPTLFLGLLVHIGVALLMVFFKGDYLSKWCSGLCLVMMSISTLFYIILGQFLLGKVMQLVPISGYSTGFSAWKFLVLPIVIGVVSGMGSGSRWMRTLLLEESEKPYVRTARAKGLGEFTILRRHVLGNALIPIVTGVVALIPLLFLGSLLMESFFCIPGLGSYTIDAILQQDFEIVRVMVFLGTIFYIVGLILTDVVYTWVDPRIRFQ